MRRSSPAAAACSAACSPDGKLCLGAAGTAGRGGGTGGGRRPCVRPAAGRKAHRPARQLADPSAGRPVRRGAGSRRAVAGAGGGRRRAAAVYDHRHGAGCGAVVLPALPPAAAGVGFLDRGAAGAVPSAVDPLCLYGALAEKTGGFGKKGLFIFGKVRYNENGSMEVPPHTGGNAAEEGRPGHGQNKENQTRQKAPPYRNAAGDRGAGGGAGRADRAGLRTAEGGAADRGRSGSAADTAAAGKRRAALRSGQEG